MAGFATCQNVCLLGFGAMAAPIFLSKIVGSERTKVFFSCWAACCGLYMRWWGKLQTTLRASSGMRSLQETAEDIKLKVFRRNNSSWKTDTIENARDLVSRLKKKLMGCKTSKRWSSHLLDSMRIEPLFLSSKLSWFFQNCLGCARMISLSHLSQVKAKQNG